MNVSCTSFDLGTPVLVMISVTFYTPKVIEEMKSSIALLEKKLEETSKERDKALQELGRLKQHLLDKVCQTFVLLFCN